MTDSLDVIREGALVTVVMNNPPSNVLTYTIRQQFASALDDLEADTTVRAVMLRGEGRNFCTGADLGEEETAVRGGRGGRPYDLLPIFRRLETLRVPVIAAIGGWCVGAGLELALCSDLRLASEDARFMCAGVNVGMLAHAYRLPRTIGVAGAKQMLYTGQPIDAARALALGLASELVPPDELKARTLAVALRIASRAPLAVEASKRMADMAIDLSPEDAAARLEEELGPLFDSQDHREALAAFREKRDPQFGRH